MDMPKARVAFLGNNTLAINIATLTLILEEWFSREFTNPPHIQSVTLSLNGAPTVTVNLTDAAPKDGSDIVGR